MQALRRGSTLFAAFLFLLFAAAIVIALTYNERARAAPIVISVPGLLLMLGWLVVEVRGGGTSKKKKASHESSNVGQAPEASEIIVASDGGAGGAFALKGLRFRDSATFRELDAFLWLAGLFVLLYVLGFAIGIPLFTFLYMKVRSHDGWRLSIALPIVAWVIMFFVFGQVARFTLYPGLIAGFFR